MIYKAIVMNASHPEYGEAMIPLPIPQEQYEDCMEMLDRMEIVGAEKALCQIQETDASIVTGRLPILYPSTEGVRHCGDL